MTGPRAGYSTNCHRCLPEVASQAGDLIKPGLLQTHWNPNLYVPLLLFKESTDE